MSNYLFSYLTVLRFTILCNLFLLYNHVSYAQPCSTAPALTIPAGSFSSSYGNLAGMIVQMQGNFTIDSWINLVNCEVRMQPGSTITVLNNQILRISGSNLFTCGTNMWKGIIVQPGATLEVNSNAIIEDAEISIYSQNGGVVVIQNATLNKNYKHFYADAFPGVHPVQFNGNVKFTCQASINSPSSILDSNPFFATRTYMGIHAENVSQLFVGSLTPGFQANYFNNLDIGVHVLNTGLEIYNNFFDNLLGPTQSIPPFPPITPFIAIQGYSTTGTETAKVIKNKIRDCKRGIFFENYKFFQASMNELWLTYATPVPNPSGNTNGESGIGAYHDPGLSANATILIHDNTVKDFSTCYFYRLLDMSNMFNHTLKILNNKAIRTLPKGVTGIRLINNFPVYGVKSGSWEVKNNSCQSVSQGIIVDKIQRALLKIESNSLTLGIGISRHGIQIINSAFFTIYDNKILGGGISSTEINHFGIHIMDCFEGQIGCNRLFQLGRSLVMEHTNLKMAIVNNRIFNAYDGFVLRNSGIIGFQGVQGFCPIVPDKPADNQWFGTYTNSHTFTDLTLNANFDSRLLIRTTGVFLPTLNLTNAGLGQEYSINNGGLRPSICPVNPPANCPWFFGLPFNPPGGPTDRIARGTMAYFMHDPTDKWRGKYRLYTVLKLDSIMLADPVLDSFFIANHTSSIGKFHEVHQALLDQDYNLASIINYSIIPVNIPEQYLQELYNFLILIYTGQSFSINDIVRIEEMAYTCPLIGGEAVYGARGVLEFYDGIYRDYDAVDCSPVFHHKFEEEKESVINISLYPNPANNSITLVHGEVISPLLVVRDMTGKIVNQFAASEFNSYETRLNISGLQVGIYLVELYSNEELITTLKLSVIR
jgi:hypothetical protein